MLLLEELRSLGIKTIWVLAHKEFLATKYVKRKALKHAKGFFMFLSISKITWEGYISDFSLFAEFKTIDGIERKTEG